MKLSKFIKNNIVLLFSVMLITSCDIVDLDVPNTNEPGREAVLGDARNTISLLRGAYTQSFVAIVTSWATQPHMLADQNTSTNLFRQFWDFAEEPRLRLNNTTQYSATGSFTAYWGSFNSAIATSNLLISSIDNDGIQMVVDGNNVTQQIRAQAFFLRGISRGYIGLIYDQGYFIDENFDITIDPATIDFQPYSVLIQGAVDDLQEATATAQSAPSFVFDITPNPDNSWTLAEFQAISNSFSARFLAGQARSANEAASLDWNRILNFANSGIGGPNSAAPGLTDFTVANVGSSGAYANYMADWLNFVVACSGTLSSCAGYNPTDVKVMHMLDPTYPVEYPAEFVSGAAASYPPAESTDPRLGYYVYSTNPGFLNPARNANLFTNYFPLRVWAGNDWWQSQLGVTLYTHVENDMLRAEANLMLGNSGEAASILNQSTAGTGTLQLSIDLPGVSVLGLPEEMVYMSGGHSYDASTSLAMFQWALLREYSVELDVIGGVGLQWYFMRRHDLHQAGTALHFPVPGSELELTSREYYTFGGANFAGEPGAASGANSWKELAAKAFPNLGQLRSDSEAGTMYGPVTDFDGISVNPDAITNFNRVGNETRRNH